MRRFCRGQTGCGAAFCRPPGSSAALIRSSSALLSMITPFVKPLMKRATNLSVWCPVGHLDGRETSLLLLDGNRGRRWRLSHWSPTQPDAAVLATVDAHCPQSIRKVGAWVKRTFGLSYSRSGLIALLHRLGFDYRKPEAMPRGLDDAKQQAFIDQYENLLNTMGADEAVIFVDAVHSTHQVRPAGCWARKDVAVAVDQTTGRERLNIHGAINLETGQMQILAVEKVNALSFIKLLSEIEGTHTAMRLIHVFVDNASYHKADVVKEWLAAAGRKIVLHFLPPYCPHLDPIERLWGLIHENVTHNRDYKTFNEFRREILKFLRHTVPKQWKRFCDRISDNFRVIHRADFRVIA